jgi:hypothetical protein
MLPVLFAVRSVWIIILFAVVGICVLWFVFRVAGDLIVWFREEVLDEHKELRNESKAAALAKRKKKDMGSERH